MTNATANTAATDNAASAEKARGARPTHRLWLVQGEGKEATWTEISALWPTRSGNGHTGIADKLLPILANHMKGRLVVLPAKFKPAAAEEGASAGGAQ
jgi:hypothetical protein